MSLIKGTGVFEIHIGLLKVWEKEEDVSDQDVQRVMKFPSPIICVQVIANRCNWRQ